MRRKLQRGDIAEVVREDNAILGWLDKLQVTVWVQQEDGLWDVVSLVNGTCPDATSLWSLSPECGMNSVSLLHAHSPPLHCASRGKTYGHFLSSFLCPRVWGK